MMLLDFVLTNAFLQVDSELHTLSKINHPIISLLSIKGVFLSVLRLPQCYLNHSRSESLQSKSNQSRHFLPL